MKTVELLQNSQEWLDFRKSRIGASDMSAIMGTSKWATPYELWKQKVGFSSGPEENWAMRRGKEAEPLIREQSCSLLKRHYTPVVGVHEDNDRFMASFDGYDAVSDTFLEIKLANEKDHDQAVRGSVPEHYVAQVQWQSYVGGYIDGYYASHRNGLTEIVFVKCDRSYIDEKLVPSAIDFLVAMDTMTPPEQEKDTDIMYASSFLSCLDKWKDAKRQLSAAQALEQQYRKQLETMVGKTSVKTNGVAISFVHSKGSVGWQDLWKDVTEAIPSLKDNFDLEDYRKNETSRFVFKLNDPTT